MNEVTPHDRVSKKSAFVLAGTHSGCGKTTLTLALLIALRRRGLTVQPFKVGPDFIDPGFHSQVSRRSSRNLDGWMLSPTYNTELFRRLMHDADVAVVEGVMGLYDGYDGLSESGSTAEMAKWLEIPAVLVVDARSMARSVAALIQGFAEFDQDLRLTGVIFNRIGSLGHLEYLKQAIRANLPHIRVIGGVPRDSNLEIPERHLGLVTADEIILDESRQEQLAGVVEHHVDLDALLEQTTLDIPEQIVRDDSAAAADERPVDIWVARDEAFCFYYPDNFELLESFGARVRVFSPLAGESFPRDCGALYLGGGYPEVHARRLAANGRFLSDLRLAAQDNMPIYAECGGLMTLSRYIETLDGERHSMAGLLPFGTRMLDRRKALGYTEVILREACALGEPGLRIRGHEFHYSEIVEDERAEAMRSAYEIRARKHRQSRFEGFSEGSVLASYIHLHWGSNPQAAANLVQQAGAYLRHIQSVGA